MTASFIWIALVVTVVIIAIVTQARQRKQVINELVLPDGTSRVLAGVEEFHASIEELNKTLRTALEASPRGSASEDADGQPAGGAADDSAASVPAVQGSSAEVQQQGSSWQPRHSALLGKVQKELTSTDLVRATRFRAGSYACLGSAPERTWSALVTTTRTRSNAALYNYRFGSLSDFHHEAVNPLVVLWCAGGGGVGLRDWADKSPIVEGTGVEQHWDRLLDARKDAVRKGAMPV